MPRDSQIKMNKDQNKRSKKEDEKRRNKKNNKFSSTNDYFPDNKSNTENMKKV